MRLLNVETFRLEELYIAHPPYAILSHTWGKDDEEVSFRDVVDGKLDVAETRPIKLSGCCKQAKEDGYKYVWIDTCCIDKTNSVELQEAINSMFRWYREAHICYAFLSDVPAGDDPRDPRSRFFSSRWFQRGWTLQELLAPPNFRFYDSNWRQLGTKGELYDVIEKITGIPSLFLLGIRELHDASVAQRMSWAATRVTKRKEDIAYCLLGIFGVTMPMIYGEGDKAFRRLQEHIMKDIGDDSILAWGLGPRGLTPDDSSVFIPGGILATTPSDFKNSGQISSREQPASDSFDVHGGSLRLHLFLFTNSAGEILGLLKCGPEHDTDRVVGIPLATTSRQQSGKYLRPKGCHAVLIPKPASEVFAKLVQILIDCERKPSTAPTQPYWFLVQKSIPNLELIDVEPRSRWHRERALIEAVTEPDGDGIQRTLTRFRHKKGESGDFIVVLEIEAQSSEVQARYHVMIASRRTTLQDIARKFSDMRLEALGKQSASNGILNLHVTLETIATQRVFVVRPAALLNSPVVTVNATFELQCPGMMIAIECIEEVEGKRAREEKELSQKLKEKSASLDQMKGELGVVKDELRKLREKESLLAKRLEDRAQEMDQLNARHGEIRQEQERMSARRLQVQQHLNELWDSKPTARENGDKSVAEDDRTLHWAAENGHEAVARLLLDKGANVAAKGQKGETPLHWAARNRHRPVARLLLERGADVTAKDQKSETPLHWAARNGYMAVDATHQDRPDQAGWLSNLGNWLGTRFERTGSINDLNLAIEVADIAIDAIPQDHPDRAGWLSNLGNWLGKRFERTDSIDDLNRAIEIARRKSPPRRERDQSPPSLGPKPSSPRSSHMPGGFDDDIDFTATLAAGLQDTGFDPNIVINDPLFYRRDSLPAEEVETPTKLSKKEQKKRDKQRRQSGDITPLEDPTPTREVVEEPTDYFFEPKLSKKEQKKRDKETARKAALAEEEIVTPVAEQIVEEPESYSEVSKKSFKNSKRLSTLIDEIAESSRKAEIVSVPVDAFDDLNNGDDDWTDIKKFKKKNKRDSERYDSPVRSALPTEIAFEVSSSRKSKPDSERYESPPRSVLIYGAASDIGGFLKRDSGRYESPPHSRDAASDIGIGRVSSTKDKSKRRSEQYEREPEKVSLLLSKDGDYEDRKSRKFSNRNSGIFSSTDRDLSRSVVSADALRYDDSELRRKKKSKIGKDDYDDTRSMVFAPIGNDYDSRKSKNRDKGKDKEKDKKSSIFSSLFSSTSMSSARDDRSKGAKDDENGKKSKKSKRYSVSDSSSIYGSIGASFVGNLSRSVSNGSNGEHYYDDDFDDSLQSDSEKRRKSRFRSESTTSTKRNSFSSNASIFSASVGLADAATIAITTQQYRQTNAANINNETAENVQSMNVERSMARKEILDSEIAEKQFRPSIDPQYGDLLPLPPSDPASPNVEPIEELPELPESRPDTPETERISREKGIKSIRRSLQEAPMKSPIETNTTICPQSLLGHCHRSSILS